MEGTQSSAWLQEAAMWMRPHRRDLVVWRQSAGPAGRRNASPGDALHSIRLVRVGRVRRYIRMGTLLILIGLLRVRRVARRPWAPVLAGVVLTTTGVVLRNGPGGLLLLPGLLFLLDALLVPASPKEDRARLAQLRRELGEYSTAAQRADLEATLDRYPDGETHELRDILARQAVTACRQQLPGVRRY
jgi:hypothetical protein